MKEELSFLWQIFLNVSIIGLDTMKTFKMVLDVGKGMVRVNVKVLPGCFKYVGGVEVLLYPVVRRVELGSASVTKVPVTVRRDPKGIVGFSCQVL